MIDASVFLDRWLEGRAVKECTHIVSRAGKTYEGLVTEVALGEIVWRLRRGFRLETKRGEIFLKLNSDIQNFQIAPLEDADTVLARELDAIYGIDAKDRLHLACAISRGVPHFVTLDGPIFDEADTISRIARENGKEAPRVTHPLKVKRRDWPGFLR